MKSGARTSKEKGIEVLKHLFAKLSIVLIYIFILLYAAEFQISQLWDTKSFLLVLSGTLLLTVGSYLGGLTRQDLYQNIGLHAISAAYLTTFISLYTKLSTEQIPLEHVVPTITVSCRPLLYGFIIHLAFSDRNPSAKRLFDNLEEAPTDKFAQKETADEAANLQTSDSGEAIDKLNRLLTKAGLTKREVEITLLVRQGLINKEIAELLFISDTTVKKHISNIFSKLGLTNREQLKTDPNDWKNI